MIELRLLGPLEIRVDGEPAPPELLWRKHAALLVHLALDGARARTRDQLIALLWPDKPEGAGRHSLNEAVRVIRRSAGAEALVSSVGSLRLAPGFVDSDAAALAQSLNAGSAAAAASTIAGDLLDGFAVPDSAAFEQWLDAERRIWRPRMLDALLAASRAEADAGHLVASLTLAQRAVALDALSEPATLRLTETLVLLGDRAGALDACAALETALTEVDATPGAAFRRLQGQIRAGTTPVPGPAAEPAPPRDRRLPMLERELELTALLAAWQRARNRPCTSLLVILGRDGCGRSRLATELAQRVRLDGAAVAFAHAVPGDGGVHNAGMLALARGGLLDAPGIAGAAPEALGTLAAAIPEWQERFPAVERIAGSMNAGFADVVRAAASVGPVVLISDDAQWIDPVSRTALLSLLRDCSSLPVCVLLTLRPADACPDIDRARAHVGREWDGAVVHVEPLSIAGISHLVEERFPAWGAADQERLARRLLADTAGLPGLVGELLSAIGAGLPPDTGTWPAPSRTLDATFPADRPDAITAAVRVNYGCLSASERELLAAASVLGERVSARLLERAIGQGEADVAGGLDRLEAQCWLESDASGYAFAARVVRDVIARDFVTRGARRRMEERLGHDPA
jgi:DNA-binding SARP family transcriptional activator